MALVAALGGISWVLSPSARTLASAPRCAIRASTEDPTEQLQQQLSQAQQEIWERAQANAELLQRLAAAQDELDTASSQIQSSANEVAVAVAAERAKAKRQAEEAEREKAMLIEGLRDERAISVQKDLDLEAAAEEASTAAGASAEALRGREEQLTAARLALKEADANLASKNAQVLELSKWGWVTEHKSKAAREALAKAGAEREQLETAVASLEASLEATAAELLWLRELPAHQLLMLGVKRDLTRVAGRLTAARKALLAPKGNPVKRAETRPALAAAAATSTLQSLRRRIAAAVGAALAPILQQLRQAVAALRGLPVRARRAAYAAQRRSSAAEEEQQPWVVEWGGPRSISLSLRKKKVR